VDNLQQTLVETQMQLKEGEITEEEFGRTERALLARIRELKAQNTGGVAGAESFETQPRPRPAGQTPKKRVAPHDMLWPLNAPTTRSFHASGSVADSWGTHLKARDLHQPKRPRDLGARMRSRYGRPGRRIACRERVVERLINGLVRPKRIAWAFGHLDRASRPQEPPDRHGCGSGGKGQGPSTAAFDSSEPCHGVPRHFRKRHTGRNVAAFTPALTCMVTRGASVGGGPSSLDCAREGLTLRLPGHINRSEPWA
jgi:hypothetical protein